MNGAKHYREAERLLGAAMSLEVRKVADAPRLLAAAQVHALLAQVAMTYDATAARETDDIPNRVEWQEALR